MKSDAGPHTPQAGFTIIELMIALAAAGIVVAASLVAMTRIHDDAGLSTAYWQCESRLQMALDDVSTYLLETRPSLVSFYTYNRDGRQHTAISFPTARDRDGNFVLRDENGAVAAVPHWQGIVVYAYADGFVRRYIDYSERSYSSPVSITNITSTQIILNDGTRFNLDGTPRNSNQRVMTVLDHARRFVAENTTPIHLIMEAEIVLTRPPQQTYVITLDTGILARNNN